MRVHGRLRPPGDKSISHRALMFAALGEGESRVSGLLDSADVRSTAGVLRALGVEIPDVGPPTLAIRGVGLRGLRPPSSELDCGNSGTTARLMAGVVAGAPLTATFVGDASLSRRPMRRIARPLEAMGARVELPEQGGLPMVVRGTTLHGVEWQSEHASAQVKSAVLLAGLMAHVPVSVREPAPSRDHTERMLRARGAAVESSPGLVRLAPTMRLAALDTDVPADPSSAAFFAALAALADDGELVLEHVCVNPTRTGFFDALRRMGATLDHGEPPREEGGEPIADLVARPGELRAITVGAAEVPAMIDEIPLLACLASRAVGTTVVTGASELRVKESDRIAAVVSNLQALGADAEELPDGLRVTGSGKPLRGRVETHADHRIAMAFGVLSAIPGNDVHIDDRSCVGVSYPGFWSDLSRVTA